MTDKDLIAALRRLKVQTGSIACLGCAMYRENDNTCGNESLQIKHAPQSWCYVENMEG